MAVRTLVLSLALLGPVLGLVGPPAAAGPAGPEGTWPLQPRPRVVRAFDPPDDPWGAGHRGVDLAGRAGQSVHAALAGTVTFAGRIAGKAVVVVAHGARRTTYEPVAATVAVGDAVAEGTPIGRLELPLGHCFPAACLHWGLLEGERYLDPLSLVGGGPVRLLPLWQDSPTVGPSGRWRAPLERWARPLDALP